MNGNPLKARLARQLPAFGGWCTTGSPFAAELIALQGFHFVGLDAQHGLFSYDSLLTCMMALARTGSAIVVRMPSRDAAAAGRILDAGAHGVIFPMIETPDDAREAVDACRIFPGGRRSFGPLRAAQSFGRDPDAVSAGVTCMAMIETARGVENIEAIAAVPGLDCLYIGPGDLAITMGLPPGLDPIPGPHADAITSARSRWPTACRPECRAPAPPRPLNWPTPASQCSPSGPIPGGSPSAPAGRATPSGPRAISAE